MSEPTETKPAATKLEAKPEQQAIVKVTALEDVTTGRAIRSKGSKFSLTQSNAKTLADLGKVRIDGI